MLERTEADGSYRISKRSNGANEENGEDTFNGLQIRVAGGAGPPGPPGRRVG